MIGDHYCTYLDEIPNDVDDYIQFVGRHNFHGYTKFGFTSSSICEVGNFMMKKISHNSVNARLSMDVSGTRQLKQVEAKARKTKAK